MIYNLILMACNWYIGKTIGTSVGRVEEVDFEYGEVKLGVVMRIQVSIDITKPILRRKCLNIGLAKQIWVHFTYERLPDVWFCYGVRKHNCFTSKACSCTKSS